MEINSACSSQTTLSRGTTACLDSQDLLPEVLEVVEGGLRRDGVDEDESLPVLHVEVPHGGELLRAGRVEDLEHALLPVHLDLLPVRVLYRRVVLLHEDPLHELDGERRLADAAGAEDDDLVLAHGCAAVAVGRSAAATGGRLRLLEELMEISIKYLVFLPSMTLFLIYR